MKASRSNQSPSGKHGKVIGLAIGETSLTAAELSADQPLTTRKLAQFVYPQGITPLQPAELGKALGQFLRENEFSAKSAVVGIPARWLLVKPKEVPPSDESTLTELLRLQAEGEFSSELKDLVYDYAGSSDRNEPRTVLLIATARKYVEASSALCEAAGLKTIAVTSSAVTLGGATAMSVSKDALVVSVGTSGAELTSQIDGVTSGIRHLRAPAEGRSLAGELRRAVSALSASTNGTTRELVLWDSAGIDSAELGQSLGMPIRSGDLSVLGVAENSHNGEARQYGPAVALALCGASDSRLTIDFLHSRLAAPKQKRVPQWASTGALALIVLIAAVIAGYVDLQSQRTKLDALNGKLAGQKNHIAEADSFVSKVSFAQSWHGGDTRYVAVLRDLTLAIPADLQTYATNLVVRETPETGATRVKSNTPPTLSGQLTGKTSDQQRVQAVMDQMKRIPAFIDVKLGGTSESGRGREVSFSINFVYLPPKTAQ